MGSGQNIGCAALRGHCKCMRTWSGLRSMPDAEEQTLQWHCIVMCLWKRLNVKCYKCSCVDEDEDVEIETGNMGMVKET